MKRRDGKRGEENVTLFFNQSGRLLDFIFFFLNTQATISTHFGLVLHKDYCVTERSERKLQNQRNPPPPQKNDSKEITACFQA